MDKAEIKYKSFANNRSASEVAFQWKVKVTYALRPDGDNTVVTIMGKNFGAGPVQEKAVKKEVDLFETAFRDSVDEISQRDTPISTNSTYSVADEIRKLADLKEQGFLTDDEFQTQKTKLLSGE